jgi:SAM-dependent methyltransferase
MRKENLPKTLETYYPHHQYKDVADIPKFKNIDFAFYFRDFLDKNYYKIIDIGCANGDFLANDRENMIGVDLSKSLLKIARKRGFNVLYADVDNSLCFKDNSFDAVYSSHVVEHVNNPISFLKECYRVLKQEGLLVIITEDFSKAYKIFYDDPTHKSPLTKRSLEKCAIESGFTDFKVEQQCVPTGMGLIVRKGLLSMNKALILTKILYKIGLYKHKHGTLVLIARKCSQVV